MALNGRPLRQVGAGLVALIIGVNFSNNASQRGHGKVVGVREVRIDGRKVPRASCRNWIELGATRIEACPLVGKTGGGQEAGVGNGRAEGAFV